MNPNNKLLYCISSKFVVFLACEIPKVSNVRALQNFRTQGSFIHINSGKIFERDLVSSDSVAKSATQKPWVF